MIDEDDFLGVKSDERLYLDLRASSGYRNEAEKLKRNDSKINLLILLKDAATKKLRLKVWVMMILQVDIPYISCYTHIWRNNTI